MPPIDEQLIELVRRALDASDPELMREAAGYLTTLATLAENVAAAVTPPAA